MNVNTGNFGNVREAYVAVRQAPPLEVFDLFWQRISSPSPRILDLGCGTGIATRELGKRKGAEIIGGDIDEKMLEVAQQSSSDIAYVLAAANHLSFAAGEFDAVTAFSAFHWFRDKDSVEEIRRVLREGGIFFVVNNNDVAGFRVDFGGSLEKLLGRKLPHPKRNYQVDEILTGFGFTGVTRVVIPHQEIFSLEDALLHIQSAGVWNEVPESRRAEARELMKQHIMANKIDGYIARRIEVQVVFGVKST